jgi:uncharacterized protein YbaR (Trm112 family)
MLRLLYEKVRAVFAAPARPGLGGHGVFDERLLSVLACPSSHEALLHHREAGELIAERAGLAYPIVDGIPILLVSAARGVHADGTEG